jgi:ABC-type multidrug transport system fused ATPase/permease subunit
MPGNELLAELARTIQLAVAPVFLLTALGTLLSVLTTRLGRIIDRARVLGLRHFEPHEIELLDEHNEELGTLSRRRWLINYAVTGATLAALQVCILIAVAFVGFMLHKNFSLLIAGMFVGAMAAFILALLLFLREILFAVVSMRIRPLPRA